MKDQHLQSTASLSPGFNDASRKPFTIGFVFLATIFVILVIGFGIALVIGPSVNQAMSAASTNIQEVLTGANSTLGDASDRISAVSNSTGVLLQSTSYAFIDAIMTQLKDKLKREMFDVGFEAIDYLKNIYGRRGRNISTIAEALQALGTLHTEKLMAKSFAGSIDGGQNYRFGLQERLDSEGGLASDLSDADGNVFRTEKRPIRAISFYSKPIFQQLLRYPPGQMGISFNFAKSSLPEFAMLAGPGYDTYARNSSAWGLQKGGWREITDSDPSWNFVGNEVINVTHKRLFVIDDPQRNMLNVKAIWQVTTRSIVPGTVCAPSLAIGGGVCWGPPWLDAQDQSPSEWNMTLLNDPAFIRPRERIFSQVFQTISIRWLYITSTIFPDNMTPESHLQPTPDSFASLEVSKYADLGEAFIATQTGDMIPILKSAIADTGYRSAFAFVHNTIGQLFSASFRRIKSSANDEIGEMNKAVVSLNMAVCDESSAEILAYDLALRETFGLSSLGFSQTAVTSICVPGPLILAAREFHNAHCRNAILSTHASTLSAEFVGYWVNGTTDLRKLQCSPYPNSHPEDRLFYISLIHDSSREYYNYSFYHQYQDVYLRSPNSRAGYRERLMLVISVLYSETNEIVDISTHAVGVTVDSARRDIKDNNERANRRVSAQKFSLLVLIVSIVIAVSFLVMVIAAVLFYYAMQPLRIIVIALEYVQDLDLNVALTILEDMKTSFSEFSGTKDGVVHMIRRLMEYRRYLPEWLLATETDDDQADGAGPSQHSGRKYSRPSIGNKVSASARVSSQKHGSSTDQSSVAELATRHAISSSHLDSKPLALLVVELRYLSDDSLTVQAARSNAVLVAAEPIVRRFRGTMAPEQLPSENQKITLLIMFNAQMACRSMSSAALDCAATLATTIPDTLPNVAIALHFGVATTTVVCGTVGTDAQRWYTAIGPIGLTARCLAAWARTFDVRIMCDEDTLNRTAVEQAAFSHFHMPACFVEHFKAVTQVDTSVVVQRLEQEEDEWMYMLENAENRLADDASIQVKMRNISVMFNSSTSQPVSITDALSVINEATIAIEDHPEDRLCTSASHAVDFLRSAVDAARSRGSSQFSYPLPRLCVAKVVESTSK